MKILLVGTSVALVGFSGAWLWQVGASGSTSASPSSPTADAMDEIVAGVGYLEPAGELRSLCFRSGGVVRSIKVEVGDHVDCGTVLAELEAIEEHCAVDEAKARLAVAQAKLAQVRRGINEHRIQAAHSNVEAWMERKKYLLADLERVQRLADRRAATDADLGRSEMRAQEATAELQRAEAELANLEEFVLEEDIHLAEAECRLAQAELSSAEAKLDAKTLKAPFDGVVLDVLKREGEGVSVVASEPVLMFATDGGLRVRAEIGERNAWQVAVGQPATITGRNLGRVAHEGKVLLVRPMMGPKTLFADVAGERRDLAFVQVLIETQEPILAPVGLRVDVNIDVNEKE